MTEIRPSVLVLPIRLSEQALHRTINQQLPNPLLEDHTGKRRITARKIKPVVVVFDKGQIFYRIVIGFELEQDALFTTLTANGSIRLDFGTRYEITPDYRLITTTTLYDHEWIKSPKLGMGGSEVSVGSAAGWALKRLRERVGQQIDRQVQQQLRLPELVKQAWQTLQQPQLLSADHRAYVQLNATTLALTEPHSKNDFLHVQLQAQVSPEVLLAETPPPAAANPLPPFAFAAPLPTELRPVALRTRLPFLLINPLIQQQVAGKTFGADNRNVTIHTIDLSGMGNTLGITANVSGSFDGELRFRCRPVVTDGYIHLEELELDLETDNFLQRTAGWLLKSAILKRLTNGVREGVEKGLEQAERQLTERLNGDLPVEGIKLDAEVDDIRIEDLQVDDTALRAHVSAKAKVALTVQQIPSPRVV